MIHSRLSSFKSLARPSAWLSCFIGIVLFLIVGLVSPSAIRAESLESTQASAQESTQSEHDDASTSTINTTSEESNEQSNSVETTSEHSASEEVTTTLSQESTISNTSTSDTTIDQSAVTGQNDLETIALASPSPSPSPTSQASVITDDATAQTVVTQDHNLNVIGTDGQYNSTVIANPHEGTLDLRGDSPPLPTPSPESSAVPTSTPATSATTTDTATADESSSDSTDSTTATNATNTASLEVDNDARVQTSIDQSAITGENDMAVTGMAQEDTAQLETGAAGTIAAVVTTANTTLIGNCFRFDITTILAPISGGILLPNEEDYVYCDQPLIQPTSSELTNEATTQNSIDATADTGENDISGGSAGTISTGNSSSTNLINERINETIVRNQWAMIRIFNPSYLSQVPILPGAQSYQIDNTLYYWWQPSASTTETQQLDISINNYAEVFNEIQQLAQTGDNSIHQTGLGGSHISTGDATTLAAIINYLNTTIIGSNWFLSDLNVLAPVQGNISTAKPDLVVSAHSDDRNLTQGEETTVYVTITNAGTSTARASHVSLVVPSGLQAIALTGNGNYENGTVSWSIPALLEGESYVVALKIRALNSTSMTAALSGMIQYALTELDTNNNYFALGFSLFAPTAAQSTQPTPITSTSTTYLQQPTQTYFYQLLPAQQLPQYYYYYPQQQTRAISQAAQQPQVLGEGVTMADQSGIIPAAAASNGVPRSSFCDRNLGLCRGIRYAFWGSIFTGLTLRIRRRYLRANHL